MINLTNVKFKTVNIENDIFTATIDLDSDSYKKDADIKILSSNDSFKYKDTIYIMSTYSYIKESSFDSASSMIKEQVTGALKIQAVAKIVLGDEQRLIILEFQIPIEGKSKTRARQSVAAMLHAYSHILEFKNKNYSIHTVTVPTKEPVTKFLRVIFDSNTDAYSVDLNTALAEFEIKTAGVIKALDDDKARVINKGFKLPKFFRFKKVSKIKN